MSKRILSTLLSDVETCVTGVEKMISTGAVERYTYIENKKSDLLESVILSAITSSLGEVQCVFPAKKGLVDTLNENAPFGSTFSLADLGTVQDVKVVAYNGALLIKFLMEV